MKVFLWMIVCIFMSYLISLLVSSAGAIVNILILLGIAALVSDSIKDKKKLI